MALRSTGVGAINIDLLLNDRKFQKGIANIANSGSRQLERSFDSTFKKIGTMAAAAFSIKAVTDFMGSCLELGSNLSEVQNVVDTAFPSMSANADEFAKNAMEAFGLSETMAKQFMGTFGAMSKSFGFAEKDALEMSKTLTGLAGDVASFYNLDPTEAYTKIKSVFTGETETLKDLGVVMTQAALDQYALANGYGRTTAKMSEQEKVALRYAFVQDQLSMATGDFIKTQDSWANQTRILGLRFDSLKASIGRGFIAVFTPVVKGINWVLSNLQSLADSFANMMEFLTGGSGSSDSGGGNSAVQEVASDLESATDSAGGLSDGLKDAGSSGEKAAKKIQKAFAKVDTINKLSFGSDSDSGSGGSGDSGSGSGGSGGSVAEAVDFPEASKQASVFDGILSGLIDEFKRLAGIFASGFEIGFGNSFANIERIKEYIASIGESLVNIFTAPEVIGAAKNWVDTTVFALGQITGSIASIGVTIATLLVGSVAEYLDTNSVFIRNTIVDWFNISADINKILGVFSTVVADIFSIFASEQFIRIGANIIQAIVNGAMNTVTLVLAIGREIVNNICEPIISNKDTIKNAISEMFNPLVEITDVIARSLTNWNSFIQIIGLLAGAFVGFETAMALVANSGAIGAITTGISVFVSGIAEGGGILTSFSALFPKLGAVITVAGTAVSTFVSGIMEGSGVIASLQAVLPASISSFSSLGTTLLGLINPVTVVIASVSSLAAGFVYLYTTSEDFRDKINEVFSSIASNVGGAINGLISIFQTLWTMGIQPVITSISEGIANLWDNGLSSFISNVSMFIANVINGVMSIWNNAVNPLINLILSIFLPQFTMAFDTILAVAVPVIEKIMEYVNLFMDVLNVLIDILNDSVFPIFKTVFNGISDAVKKFYDLAKPILDDFMDVLGGVVEFALDYFLAPLSIAFQTAVEVIKSISDPIKQTLDGVRQMLQGVIDFVTGIFLGNWNQAWEGVKSIFSGIWNSLSGIVETVWNTILGLFANGGKIFTGVVEGIEKVFKNIVNSMISGINKVIRVPFDKINNLLNSIRDFSILGQKPFKGLWGKNPLPVPQIPKLAQGGYVKPNQPQLAMIGDNKRYGEIVAPEDKMIDMIDTALKMQKASGNVEGIDTLIELIRELIDLVKNMVLKVDIDIKKLSVLLENAKKER